MRIRHQSENAEKLASVIVDAMESIKGKDIVALDLRNIDSAVTDYFIICHATSRTQVDAIADKVVDMAREAGYGHPYHVEGRENAEWILVDFVDVVAHIFIDNKRGFYQLEELWADAEHVTF